MKGGRKRFKVRMNSRASKQLQSFKAARSRLISSEGWPLKPTVVARQRRQEGEGARLTCRSLSGSPGSLPVRRRNDIDEGRLRALDLEQCERSN